MACARQRPPGAPKAKQIEAVSAGWASLRRCPAAQRGTGGARSLLTRSQSQSGSGGATRGAMWPRRRQAQRGREPAGRISLEIWKVVSERAQRRVHPLQTPALRRGSIYAGVGGRWVRPLGCNVPWLAHLCGVDARVEDCRRRERRRGGLGARCHAARCRQRGARSATRAAGRLCGGSGRGGGRAHRDGRHRVGVQARAFSRRMGREMSSKRYPYLRQVDY